MDLIAATFTLLVGILVVRLPRSWAALPLLMGATYMTLGQNIELGPFHFTVVRILIAVGFIRVLSRHERITGGWTRLDRMILAWAVWMVISSCLHEDVGSTLISHLGLAYDALGLYFLLRVFIEDEEGILHICKIVSILLVPIALEMITESITGRNSFSIFGGVLVECEVRGGKIRAQGPFGHSILAGTVGAVCLPMAMLLWRRSKKLAMLGLISCCCIILTSRSSGPIMTAAFVMCGLALWKAREHMRLVRWAAVAGLVALNAIMKAPVYYILAKIDLTGSSTGWHRAALIESAINHFNEWWLGGTDYTRHWMPTGVDWSKNHTDITNHYIKMGVIGGFLLMLLFIGVLVVAFASVGKAMRSRSDEQGDRLFLMWTLGAILFAHTATMMSVSYFDQSIVFLYVILAAIASLGTIAVTTQPAQASEPLSFSTPVDEGNLHSHC